MESRRDIDGHFTPQKLNVMVNMSHQQLVKKKTIEIQSLESFKKATYVFDKATAIAGFIPTSNGECVNHLNRVLIERLEDQLDQEEAKLRELQHCAASSSSSAKINEDALNTQKGKMIRMQLFDWNAVWSRFGRELSIEYAGQLRKLLTDEQSKDLTPEDILKKKREIFRDCWKAKNTEEK